MVDGLYSTYGEPKENSTVGDFYTIVYRQQLLGFNAVRLPFRLCTVTMREGFFHQAPMAGGIADMGLMRRFADLNISPAKNYTRPCTAATQAEIQVCSAFCTQINCCRSTAKAVKQNSTKRLSLLLTCRLAC